MIVYKTFFKIVKKHLPLLLMYVGIFSGIATMNIMSLTEEPESSYVDKPVNVAIINQDQNGEISKALSAYIGERNEIVKVEDDREAMQDALFYRAAEYIIVIPNNFTKDFLEGKDVEIERMRVPDSYSAYYIDNMIDKYLNLVNLYNIGSDQSIEDIVKDVQQDVQVSTGVEMVVGAKAEVSKVTTSVANFTAYIILAITILFIGMTIGSFNEKNMKRRNNVSPISSKRFALAQIICNGLLVLGIVVINFLITLILCWDQMFTLNGLIMFINMLACGLVALAIGFLVANVIKSKNGQNAAANTIALGFSFITGVFVPLEILDKSVVAIARFTPVYWFVRVNEEVSGMTDITFSKLDNTFLWIGIQVLFAAAILTVGMAISKNKAMGDKE